ncbi:MAG: hypothetical protein JWM80_3225 [Cyanobacteria bacterium RYN_339]|nr:hypothetical protein [Cyanobacteria bacterium RYN_339]
MIKGDYISMHKPLLTAMVAVSAFAALTACSPDKLASAVSAVSSLTGKLNGTVYLPNDQVAIVAQGGGNIVAQGGGNVVGNSGGTFAPGFGLLVRSDEKGVDGAKVVLTGGGKSFTAYTANVGKFTVECPQGVTYTGTATVTFSNNTTITLTGIATNAIGTAFNFDVAMNTVASKILAGGASAAKVDGTAVAALVALANTDLEKVARTPAPANQTEAAAAFDAYASDDLKAKVTALIAASK